MVVVRQDQKEGRIWLALGIFLGLIGPAMGAGLGFYNPPANAFLGMVSVGLMLMAAQIYLAAKYVYDGVNAANLRPFFKGFLVGLAAMFILTLVIGAGAIVTWLYPIAFALVLLFGLTLLVLVYR